MIMDTITNNILTENAISFLEELGGLNDCGYNNKEDEQHIENFFKKLKDYDERSN